MSEFTENANVLITHDVGLHARPSVKLTKLAKTFSAGIELAASTNGPWIDAKSIVKVMAMKAPKGTLLYLRAAGVDAESALDAIVALVKGDFDTADKTEQAAGGGSHGGRAG